MSPASGWQELDFSSPVPVTAGTTYVASYHTDAGHYAVTSQGLASAVTNGPLTALAGGGVYAYGSGNTFPSDTYNSANYWVDVVFSQSAGSTPPAVTTVTPGNGATGVAVSVAPTATFSEAVQPEYRVVHGEGLGRECRGRDGELQRRRHDGDVHADEPADGEHHVHGHGVGGAEQLRHGDEQPVLVELHHRRWLSARAASGRTGRRRASVDANDASPVNLGVQFQASGSGYITGVRFYKYSDNTGTHTGSLWTADGHVAGDRHVQRRVRRRAGRSWTSPARCRSRRGRRTWPRITPMPGTTRSPAGAGVGGDERAADRAGRRRGVRLRLGECLPVEHLQRVQLLGRRGVLAVGGEHAAGGDDGDAGRRGDGGGGVGGADGDVLQAVTPSTVSFTVKDSGGNSGGRDGELQRRRHGGDVHADAARWRGVPRTRRRCRGRRTPPARR